jgi:hypothetical protein
MSVTDAEGKLGYKSFCPECKRESWIPNATLFIHGQPSEGPIHQICNECRQKMEQVSVFITYYPKDGGTEISGHCMICNHFPCQHYAQMLNKISGQTLKNNLEPLLNLQEPQLKNKVRDLLKDLDTGC